MIKPKVSQWILSAVAVVALVVATKILAQSDLKITYGNNGIQQLVYRNVVLEDLSQAPADLFHIWHMKSTDLQGNILPDGQYGWGENNNGRTWDAARHSWTYKYVWGSISLEFQQAGDTLNMIVTQVNDGNSGIILDGATIYPFALHFPSLPSGFTNASYPQLAFNTTGPSVTVADYGQGEVVSVVTDATKPLYSGFEPAGSVNTYAPIVSATAPDNLAAFFPHNDRPLLPGQTNTFTVSLRFAPSGTQTAKVAQDAYQNWVRVWPSQLRWNDRRIIGTVYLASSPQGNITEPGGYPSNPRRYFNDGNPGDFDIRTPAGLVSFQEKVLQQAVGNVQNLKRLNAQGVIVWDIEGQQYPQTTSYVCEPDEIAQVAPEMESIIGDNSSPYHGMKLDDAYFKIMRDAGFAVGVCVRPQHFTPRPDGTASQVYLNDSQIPGELIRKMQYAHNRWGATLFYLDSTVAPNGAILDASIFQKAAAALPNSLLLPEETTPKYYAYAAAFKSFIFHTDLGTDGMVYNYYPHAFSAILVNDVNPGKLSMYEPQLTASVRRGDLLMVHADYWQANNATALQIYENAHSGISIPTPTAKPAINSRGVIRIVSPGNGDVISGVVLIQGEASTRLGAAGSHLLVDGNDILSSHVTSLPSSYKLDTTTLSNGLHTFEIWAEDSNGQDLLSGGVSVTVANH